MNDTTREDRVNVYEIGYLIAGVPEEAVQGEADRVRGAIVGAGAEVIGEEAPRHERLAYTIRKKTVAGSYDKHDEAHFGWIKFELASDKVEAVKKTVEAMDSVLRMLLITTVKESTYLGKHAPAVVAAPAYSSRKTFSPVEGQAIVAEAAPAAAPATVEEMDKSIDEMVKEA